MTQSTLLKVTDLTKLFGGKPKLFAPRRPPLLAVDGISLDVMEGETLGVVGESGCGKSTLGRLLVRLLDATSGSITFDGADMLKLRGSQLRAVRRDIGMVFQDPFASLDGRMKVGDIIAEPIDIHRMATGQ